MTSYTTSTFVLDWRIDPVGWRNLFNEVVLTVGFMSLCYFAHQPLCMGDSYRNSYQGGNFDTTGSQLIGYSLQ